MFNRFHQSLIDNYRNRLLSDINNSRCKIIQVNGYLLGSNYYVTSIAKLSSSSNFYKLSTDSYGTYEIGHVVLLGIVKQLIPQNLLTHYPELLL